MINSSLYINTDCIEVINIVGQYSDKYESVRKVHSKGEPYKMLLFFTGHHDEDLYDAPWESYSVGKKAILEHINPQTAEFGPDGELYYKPHVEITFKGNKDRKLTKYFNEEQELRSFFEHELISKVDISKMVTINYNNVL